ncbi:alpha/beta hydrolase family protein [Massilia litorea]|uniref:S9 family peptidase n=1 Tax=Massilia litorea TaxID=2769491 RepID=A0A7L9U7R4_9BURK|nr:S9 family peptidase [Massilia litorea]QOL50215.1 S9 family peptidase [Massilia litorea]
MNLLTTIAFLCAAFFSTTASSQVLTPEELTDPAGMLRASLSPDGRHIAAIIFNGLNHGLILIDTDTLAVKKLIQGKRFSKGYWSYNKAPRDLTWADNDLIAIDYGYDAESIDLQGKRVRMLGDAVLGRVDSGPNAGQLIVMRDEKNDLVARCHARTGECTRFSRPPGRVIQRAFDRQGNLRAVTLVNSAFFKDVSTISNWYKPADKETWTKLAEFSVTDEYWIPVHVPDEPDTLVINSRIGRDTHALFNYDIQQRRQTELLAGHPTQDIVSWGGIDKAAFDYVETSGMLPQQVWFDPAWALMQKQIDALLPGRINVISGDPARAVLVHSHGDVDPGTWYFFDIAKKSLVTVGKVMPEIDPARMRPMEVISYKAADGLSIPAYLTRPAQSTGPAPMVVLIHGGPVARDRWEWDADVQLLANRGYLVFQPQFRGSSGFGRRFEQAGFGQWGKAMQDDITDGVRHLVSQSIADPRRICIVGASYGGYAALWGLVKTPDLYRCAISFAGVTDIEYMFSDASDRVGDKVSRETMTRRIGDKKMSVQLFDPVSPLKHAARIQAPVLLMHGKDDERVPVSHGKKMRDALAANGKPVTWLAFDEEGHGLLYVKNRIQYYEAMLEFLGKHIPPQPLQTPAAAPSATSH